MEGQSIIGIGLGLILLICLPFILTEIEIRNDKPHIHTVEVVNMLGGIKPVTVTYCHDERMLVNRLGEHYHSQRVEEIEERYENK